MTWMENVKKMKRLRAEMFQQKLEINEDLFCIALINGSKLDAGKKLTVENMPRNVTQDKSLTVKGTEDAILRMRGEAE